MDSDIPVPKRFLAQPWKALATPRADGSYLALLTYFHLSSFRRIVPFLLMSTRVGRQVEASPGAMGYTLAANPLKRRFWTLSAWEDPEQEGKLRDFVRATPHRDAMRAFGAASGVEFKALRWRVGGSDLPLTWKAGSAQLHVPE